ncbi:hypothetical protein HanIR_Chr04g0161421 [Helianthus annuus]|nr:hypothetical protein HanIR_Chr04g0161421 [Helianthus annuus]
MVIFESVRRVWYVCGCTLYELVHADEFYGFELMADHVDSNSIFFAAEFSYIDSICRLDL